MISIKKGNKRSQEQKCKILAAKPKRAQEEMVGFALIIIIVGIILLVFLGFTLVNKNKSLVESYEVESYVHSVLQYTSDCEDRYGFISIKEMIVDCSEKKKCADGRDICTVLGTTLEEMLDESWKVAENAHAIGYSLNITIRGEPKNDLSFNKGNLSGNSKGYTSIISKRDGIDFSFTAYY